MKVLSPLIGYLGRATGARSNTPEPDDTKLTLPGLLNLTVTPPFPTFTIMNAPVAGGTPPVTNSFIYAEFGTFNVGTAPQLFQLGPGLWRFNVNHWSEEQGAVSDATSTQIVQLIETASAAPIAILSKITNKQGSFQNFSYEFTLTTVLEQAWAFGRTNLAGLGTGLNVGHLVIIGQRLY